ncbi:MAG: Gfo/Idh/MocA family oxidoreductase [Pirellulales bacterium]|nr:Gfo/Idh/MocA family oxidoreductase [Pirellulales bacterium]
MKTLRFGMIGAGFWAKYQLAAWGHVPGVRCTAIANRTRGKADRLAAEFDVPATYDDVETMLAAEEFDFIDVVTDVGTHRRFVELVAKHKLDAICQKPLAESTADVRAMIAACREAGTRLLVHENWRWQTPLRAVKAALEANAVGKVFRARIQYSNSFPVFDNQPFLRSLDRFLLMDIGTHVLDAARFLFGEFESAYCQTCRVHQGIRGEDVATVMLRTVGGATVNCEMSYASRLENERFPQTFLLIEGERGSIELGPDYWVRTTTSELTDVKRHAPYQYPWADRDYDVVHASIVPCLQNLIAALRCTAPAETTAADNLRTLELVEAAYESAATGCSVKLRSDAEKE